MDFRKLESFFTIANTGKFVDAADKLFISQSSLSKQMSQLERELGVKLFKKTRSGIELTQAGRDFYGYVRKALPEYQHEVAHLQQYKRESTFVLSMGALPLTEEYGFAECFASYWVRNTSVQIKFYERNQNDLLESSSGTRSTSRSPAPISWMRTGSSTPISSKTSSSWCAPPTIPLPNASELT